MKKIRMFVAVLAGAMLSVGSAHAAITLTFDELNGSVNESPAEFYNGGFGSAGTGPGPSDGISFSNNTITGCQTSTACSNTNADGSPSQPNIIFFLSGGASVMNVAAGFDTGFSFFYSAINVPGVVNVFDGLNGTGNLLASLNLAVTPSFGDPSCAGSFCPLVPFGVTFSGIAHSVNFAGTDNQIAFDNITLGSAIPGGAGVPEPSAWMLTILGFGMVGSMMRARQQQSSAGRRLAAA
jgi:hypothetical protein